MEHIGIKISIPSRVATIGASTRRCMVSSLQFGGSTPGPRVDHGREMESPPRLGLGIINIAPFVE